MSYLEIGGNRVSVEPGDGFIGSDPASKVKVDGPGVVGRHARISATADGQVSVMIVDPATVVTINGVPLGPQPHPLLHGDKIGIGSVELLFAEETTSGSTQYVSAVDAARLAGLASAAKPATAGQATAATGGRLVCLTDGREYTIGSSVLLGREAGCDVVVTSKNVSRKHAEIVVTPEGYMLIDTSTNGTLVNGQRVAGQHLLARAEVIKIGDDEFRFYADVSKPPPAAPPPGPDATIPQAPPAPPPGPDATVPQVAAPPPPPAGADHRLNNTMHGMPATPRPPAPAAPAPPPGAHYRLNDTMHGVPSGVPTPPAPPAPPAPPPPAAAPPRAPAPPAPPPPAPPAPQPARPKAPEVLANLVIRSGKLMGQRIPIRVPIVNIGRADYNDIVLPEDSVSTIHAKLQRREGMWFLIDLDSTNGSFVDGEQVTDDVPLAPGAVVRFGEVKTFFEPTDDTVDPAKGSSTKMMGAIKLPPTPPTGG